MRSAGLKRRPLRGSEDARHAPCGLDDGGGVPAGGAAREDAAGVADDAGDVRFPSNPRAAVHVVYLALRRPLFLVARDFYSGLSEWRCKVLVFASSLSAYLVLACVCSLSLLELLDMGST